MGQQVRDREAYQRVTDALRRQKNGATVADIVAKTALPLQTVRELVPQAADEYSGRLEVTESGEIRYSFPQGFVSKYRGFRFWLRKAGRTLAKGLKATGIAAFKVWIMVMLVGYFAIFMLIALASLLLSVAASSQSNSNNSSSNRGGGLGGLYLTSRIFNMIIRLWFYSELFKSPNQRYSDQQRRAAKPKGRPLHRAIFSFIFGDGDPNVRWEDKEKQAVIAYIQANRGVISLPELMTLTGKTSAEAEERITGYCAEFGGSPEATEDGTVVYRFDELLLRVNTQDRSFAAFSAPIKLLKFFSANPKKMNGWFSAINGANLLFGGYFLYNALNTGAILTQAHFQASSYVYGLTYMLLSQVLANPLPAITIGLGIVPLIFSILFWLIPGLRYFYIKGDNERITFENFRKDGYGRIWNSPVRVNPKDLNPRAAECRPRDLAGAQDRVIKEIGAYAMPEVAMDETGAAVYTFTELSREKEALEKYRGSVDLHAAELGKTVFDSGAKVE
ncbi:hypothetical protein FACS189493_4040 [Spirochaetia bacterium]|nr:hypothetical protein FACS189493_4040 [Spirochaetia bacterium]